jgi:hypothetical protein
MEKLFHCAWTDKDKKAVNSYDHEEREEPLEFFSEDNGYTRRDMEVINKIEPGDTYNCEYGNHTVRRVK